MAGVAGSDERGVVYVEFLIAFIPLFVLFLALCQLALVAASEAVVRHSAFAAVRSAIVVLEDDPAKFDGADRGSLSQGNLWKMRNLETFTSQLGIDPVTFERPGDNFPRTALDRIISQQGARMVPVQTAAFLPLLSIAPNEHTILQPSDSIGGALLAPNDRQLGFATQYTKLAAFVTIHDSPDDAALALDPIPSHAPITTRVTYLFHCTIPVVRAIMCRSLDAIRADGYIPMAIAHKMDGLVRADARFKLLSATATLPNQGASYLPRSVQ